MQEANPQNLVLVSEVSQSLLGSAITTEDERKIKKPQGWKTKAKKGQNENEQNDI